MRDAGICDDDGEVGIGKGEHLGFARAAVDLNELIYLAEGGGKLIHDAAGDSGKIVLGLLREEGFFPGIESDAKEAFKESGDGTFQGCGGRESSSRGNRGDDAGVEARDLMAEVVEAFHDPTDVVGPLEIRDFLRCGEIYDRFWLVAAVQTGFGSAVMLG